MQSALRPRVLFISGLLAITLATPVTHAATLNTTANLIDEDGPAPAAPIPPSDQPQFAKVIDDLPLMPGLALEQDDDVLFSTSRAGRIAETEANGVIDIDDVYRFYTRTLPQLGWRKIDARRFRRDDEILRIDARADDKQTRVLFSVTPVDK